MALLECPLCEYKVLPTDDYVLQLHFEQVHTEDSPFIIEDDPEPLPPPLPPRPSTSETESEEEGDVPAGYVLCPQEECGEVVLLTDFNDHLDMHTAETLSFDETTGQYHSNQPTNMQQVTNATRSKGHANDPRPPFPSSTQREEA